MKRAIDIIHMTKDYGYGKGIFDVSLTVEEGETFGYLGPNGAGKTTTIRQLMGFIQPDDGKCQILGMDCFEYAPQIQKDLGYLAGEIAFMNDMKGPEFLDFMADMKGVHDKTRMKELMEMFELDPRGRIKKMSKGMKQKLGIIAAFMDKPKVLILDEPTSGLDPLMQNRFVELIQEEKKRGATILMSSHIFEEVEKTCDRTAIIRDGKLVAVENIHELSKHCQKNYRLTLKDELEADKLVADGKLTVVNRTGRHVELEVGEQVNETLRILSGYDLDDLDITKQTLEDIFLRFYEKGGDGK